MKTSDVLIIVSYVMGGLNLVALLKWHPIQVAIFGVAAILYFVGKSLAK